jgi:hypothetical protein
MDKVRHRQNALSVLGYLHRARCAGPGKAAHGFFTELSAVELFTRWGPINKDLTANV